jgi:hypothetical protein
MTLSRASDDERKIAADFEQKLKSITPASQPLPTAKVTETDVRESVQSHWRAPNQKAESPDRGYPARSDAADCGRSAAENRETD